MVPSSHQVTGVKLVVVPGVLPADTQPQVWHAFTSFWKACKSKPHQFGIKGKSTGYLVCVIPYGTLHELMGVSTFR
ncbi:hypothetical protein PoB_007413300 [Plakobranchus ocellatus]|uniref:Uncharacterized protein n=1 Tax=Plakobranchus ocellatus TaxID=259542 RepID=A0AAV4DTJ9_9GAST|nr:hypothetical protein PoB_007413300 [Plakobranchus ocellatus]